MDDIVLPAFSLFFIGSPWCLACQRRLEDGQGRSNCQTLEAAGPLIAFRRLDNRMLIALDGTEHFCSHEIQCPRSGPPAAVSSRPANPVRIRPSAHICTG
jgi:hypothetical protein